MKTEQNKVNYGNGLAKENSEGAAATKSEHYISFRNVGKTFSSERGQVVEALSDVSFGIDQKAFVSVIGPSGCGKSTLLRILAGLEQATTGCIEVDGAPQNKPNRKIGFVFQQYSLLPWRTVEENIALGLEIAGVNKAARSEQVSHYLELTKMAEFRHALPHELSGGMQQRVAIARALANEPEILLMDEPFGALDAYTRIVMQRELLRIWEQDMKTVLFVTHSVDEAIYLSDKIILMSSRPGRIKEIINVEIGAQRTRSNPKFGELADYILDRLEEESAKTD